MKHIGFVFLTTAIMALSAPNVAAQGLSRLSPRSKMMAAGNAATVTAYIHTTADADWDALRALGVDVALRLDGVATARIPADKLAAVGEVKGVTYVQASAQVSQMLDVARPEAGADRVASGTGLDRSYTGKGVVVGIVDAGFDYTHDAFRDADGRLRIKRVWEQSSTPSGSYHSPEAYGYGIELTTEAELTAAAGDISNNSHGTHVAAIAAGSDGYKSGAYHGVAPDADIVLVSMGASSRDNVNLTNAISYIFDYAEAEGKPCVVNLSLGNHAGPHDGTSTFDVLADRLQGPGRLIVGSAGNHRSDPFHVSRTFASASDAPLRTFVDFIATPSLSNYGGDIEIWGSAGADFEVTLSAFSLFNKTDAQTVTIYPSDQATQTVSLGRYVTGDITVASEVSPLNNKPHLVITSAVTGLRANHALAINVTPKGAGQVDIWADNTKLHLDDKDIEGFSAPAGESTICEIGGTAKRMLSVGAYTTRKEYTLLGETEVRTLTEELGAISSFSSYGPTADGRLKPEVAAPGCFIISAVSQNDASGTLLMADSHNDGTRYHSYGYMQGTSMAAPFVTGTVATWLQARPTLSPEELFTIVKATARRDTHTGDIGEGGDNSWGYGKIDAYEGLRQCIDLNASGIESATAPFEGSISLQGGCIRIVRASSAGNITAAVYAVDGTQRLTRTITDNDTSMDISSLPAGIYVLRIADGKSVKAIKFSK